MSHYWPWWVGAIALATIIINYTVTTDRSFGISSAWERVVNWRGERQVERVEAQFGDEQALVAALAAASAAQFPGAAPTAPQPPASFGTATTVAAPMSTPATRQQPVALATPSPVPTQRAASPAAPPPPAPPAPVPVRTAAGTANSARAPLASQAALLISVFIGGLAAATTSGRFKVRLDMGDGYRHIVTANPLAMVAILFVGGVLVGFGTRLAGGCSSGHGLSGCGRLQPVSIVATAVFFGTAVATSFLLWKVI